jgi:phosphatidylserine decarboxylase
VSDPRWRPLSEGWPLLLPLAVLGLVTSRFSPRLGALLLVTAGAVALTLRDPERAIVGRPDVALAPADGRVVHVEQVRDDYFGTTMLEIGIFLALWDVHIQRFPVDGTVVAQRRQAGEFRPAFTREATRLNAQLATYLETVSGPCVVTQISGLVARRIVCWAAPGDRVTQGQRLGLIKLGSQVTLRLPSTATAVVRVGEHVAGGTTPLARLESSTPG